MATRQKEADPPTLSYYVSSPQGDFILQVKADWKVTFGAVNPGAPTGRGDLHCLRVWEGEKLRAVFCDIRNFRDLSIPLARKVSKETGQSSWTQDSEGNFARNEERQIEQSYTADVDPDDIPF
ncbi:MAG TPA: hypothetical protein VK631_11980 [Solirubrobacteraceae bacterium]|nr:hypothetical protein [Solirubrobacteraceae bacterium]